MDTAVCVLSHARTSTIKPRQSWYNRVVTEITGLGQGFEVKAEAIHLSPAIGPQHGILSIFLE